MINLKCRVRSLSRKTQGLSLRSEIIARISDAVSKLSIIKFYCNLFSIKVSPPDGTESKVEKHSTYDIIHQFTSGDLPNGVYRNVVQLYTDKHPIDAMLYWHIEITKEYATKISESVIQIYCF